MGFNLCKRLAATHTALLETSDRVAKTLQVRIRELFNVNDVVLGACYRPPDQEGEVEEAFI